MEGTTGGRSVAPPGGWRGEVEARLAPGEAVLAWFAPDLDEGLRFADGLVVLTDRRILEGRPAAGAGRSWRDWPIAPGQSVRATDRAGLGMLELSGPSGRLAAWRFTVARAASARKLADRFETLARDGVPAPDAPADDAGPACPTCGGPLPADDEPCPDCAGKGRGTASALFRLVKTARNRSTMIALGFGLTLASTAAGLIPPYLTKPLVDDVLAPYDAGQAVDFALVPWYFGAMLGAALLTWVLSWARTYVVAWVSERIAGDLRARTYDHLQKLSLEYFGGKRTGDLITRISSDSDRICDFLSINLLDFAADVLMITLTFILLMTIDWPLALAALVPFPLVAYLVNSARGRLLPAFQWSRRTWSEMTSVLADTIPGIRVVKAFAQERREVDRFLTSNTRVMASNDRVNVIWAFIGPLATLLTQLGLLVVYGIGAWRLYEHHIQLGSLTAAIALTSRFYVRLESMSRMFQSTQRAGASARRIFEILDRVPSVPEPTRPVHPGRVSGRIELRSVGFRHGNRRILEGLDLAIEPGEMIGLVGPSGAGKSTLVNLVCRFYDVADGAILVDGTDIRSFPVSEYRRNIGIVLQEPFLFFGTVAENIAYGRPDTSRDEIIAAARAARAHEFILRLPDGYDSIVGERGQALSGGERQRISIARALLIDPRILILDEATSSVDTETEREIQEALDNLTRGRTTIAIAHRLSTLRKADRLVVLERGRIAEVGPHHELLQAPGAYARLHRAQLELAALGPDV